jgi:inositol-pentakisphosphate 2-kinase
LIRLDGGPTVAELNRALSEANRSRRCDFLGSKVAEVSIAMLVEDMRPRHRGLKAKRANRDTAANFIPEHPDDIFLEFKPKWLAQSPNAPERAIRCRNCAREVSKGHKDGNPMFCPLFLLYCGHDDRALERTIRNLTSTSKGTDSQRIRLAQWLRGEGTQLFTRLRDVQTSLDQVGPLKASIDDHNFQLAMTLRDCTCFVRIPSDPERPVEAKLADLDKKNIKAKIAQWRKTEAGLAEMGYYFGNEKETVKTSCFLESNVC